MPYFCPPETVGMVVIDELHMMGNDRGTLIEILTTKVKMAAPSTRIVGMSATIANLEDIAKVIHVYSFKLHYMSGI